MTGFIHNIKIYQWKPRSKPVLVRPTYKLKEERIAPNLKNTKRNKTTQNKTARKNARQAKETQDHQIHARPPMLSGKFTWNSKNKTKKSSNPLARRRRGASKTKMELMFFIQLFFFGRKIKQIKISIFVIFWGAPENSFAHNFTSFETVQCQSWHARNLRLDPQFPEKLLNKKLNIWKIMNF